MVCSWTGGVGSPVNGDPPKLVQLDLNARPWTVERNGLGMAWILV